MNLALLEYGNRQSACYTEQHISALAVPRRPKLLWRHKLLRFGLKSMNMKKEIFIIYMYFYTTMKRKLLLIQFLHHLIKSILFVATIYYIIFEYFG